MPSKALKDLRKTLTDRTNRVLLMYRRHCASAVQAGQVGLPLGLAVWPQLTLAAHLTRRLQAVTSLHAVYAQEQVPQGSVYLATLPVDADQVGGNVTSDVRSHYMRIFRSASVTAIMNLLYPRMLSIHDLSEETGFPGPNGRLRLPRFMRASYAYMVAEGAYLMCKPDYELLSWLVLTTAANGEIALVWLGSAVSPQVLDDLYGVENLDELDVRMVCRDVAPLETR